jgi:uncharacterized membrane protein YgdD (TMEM256/DUF423 family)
MYPSPNNPTLSLAEGQADFSGIIAKGGKLCIVPLMNWQRMTLAIAGILGSTALMIGAYAAHAKGLDAHASDVLERTAMYQLIHALLLAILALHYRASWRAPIILVGVGVLFFCGAIYLRYLAHIALPVPLAPIGGVTLMLGWLSLSLAALRKRVP